MSVLCLGEVWLELNAATAPELTETFRAQTGGRCHSTHFQEAAAGHFMFFHTIIPLLS